MKQPVFNLNLENPGLNDALRYKIEEGDILILEIDPGKFPRANRDSVRKLADYVTDHKGFIAAFTNEIGIESINLKECNVVIIKAGFEHRKGIADAIRRNKPLVDYFKKYDCQLLILPDYVDVCQLDEKEMNKLGWYRKNDERRTTRNNEE